MNDLPQKNQQPTSPVGSMAKETGPHITFNEIPELTEVGKEIELSPEVSKAGVMIKPTTVSVSPQTTRLGVKPIGTSSVTAAAAPAVPLPLTDDQIATGLHQSIVTSWRWLAEWCLLQLKKAHVVIKTIHGNIVRRNG